MHMLSRKVLNSAELETVRVSKSPTTVVAANGEVQIKEEATVCVKEMDLFVTVKLLEDTPAVLSLSENSAKIANIPASGPVARNNNSSKMAQHLLLASLDWVFLLLQKQSEKTQSPRSPPVHLCATSPQGACSPNLDRFPCVVGFVTSLLPSRWVAPGQWKTGCVRHALAFMNNL